VQQFGDLIHSVNPLKLYEYMASGLPVVSTEWDELKNLNSPALLSNSEEEFKNNILAAIQNPEPKEFYKNFAKQHDWSHRADRLIQLLEN
jgi:glycosyltransferase involved in cell wall biosynthesis